MYNHQIYASGVYATLKVHWHLRCETPLAIRNGLQIGYTDRDQKKSRGMGLRFIWQSPNGEHEVTALHYGYEIKNARVNSYHFIPPSSIRGAIRSWTINHLIPPDYRHDMTPPKKTGEKERDEQRNKEYLNKIQNALADPASGYQWVASLFGQAFDTRDEEQTLSNSGRLRIETTRFDHGESPQPIVVNGLSEDGIVGPGNAKRQMSVRNPLDRMTHASKEGGLHHFLEFCKGESFGVDMTVLNPQGSDLGLFSLWRQEIEEGLLRFGALASIGRGRVSIHEEKYQLWLGPNARELDWLKYFETSDNPFAEDALAKLWKSYQLPVASLNEFVRYLQ